MSGHAIGLCSADQDVAGMVQVICHTSNVCFTHQRGERWRIDLILRGIGPLMVWLTGYVPGKRAGLNEDLPDGVAIEWGAWAGMQRYFFGDPTLGATERFSRVTHPVLVYGFDDGPWVTPAVINALAIHFMNTRVERRQITPAQAGNAVGHVGFFCMQFTTTLWPDLVDWLYERVATTYDEAGAARWHPATTSSI